MDPLFAGVGGAMVLFGVLFAVLFVAVLTFIIVVIVRNAQKAKAAGYDPLTLQTDLTTRAMGSPLLQPAKSLEQRLAEVDDLHSRGVISDAEHAAARAEILRG